MPAPAACSCRSRTGRARRGAVGASSTAGGDEMENVRRQFPAGFEPCFEARDECRRRIPVSERA